MRREKCADCGVDSPETETEYTLISSRYGWRVVRHQNAAGETVFEWRCPTCWKAHKANPQPQPSVRPARPSTAPPSGRFAAVTAGKMFDRAVAVLRDRTPKKG